MALRDHQKAALEEAGIGVVSLKLATYGGGRGTLIGGFKCGEIARGDIEEWLMAKTREEHAQQLAPLRWAKVAAWAVVAGTIVAVFSGFVIFPR